MIIENSKIYFSVGLSIGSVPPNNNFNCVRNITFRNVEMFEPIKSIYIKTNPGDEGSGVIENILYENITSNNAIWWNIYIGPQQ
jgi:polygalacturonase